MERQPTLVPLQTDRLRLRPFEEGDRANFAILHADPRSMRDYPAPLGRAASDQKFDSYMAARRDTGLSRLCALDRQGNFLGYIGLMVQPHTAHLDRHVEIGWRLLPGSWGQGLATEGAKAVLADAFHRIGLDRVLAYTAPENHASQSVMSRLGLRREPSLDHTFTSGPDTGWHGLVWVATPEMFSG